MIGRRLVKALADAGHDPVTYDIVHGLDVRDPRRLMIFLEGADAVFHLAAKTVTTTTFYAQPEEVMSVGIEGTATVLRCAKEAGVKDFILASSAEVYGEPLTIPTPETESLKIPDPLNPRFSYAASKIAAEMMVLHATGFERVQVFRPHNVYASDSKPGHVIPDFIAQARTGPIRINGSGFETRSFCHVDDVIRGILLMWEKGESGIYHIGNDRETSMLGLAWLIRDGEVERDLGALASGSPKRRLPDLTKMRALGYEPQIKLREGLKPLIAAALLPS